MVLTHCRQRLKTGQISFVAYTVDASRVYCVFHLHNSQGVAARLRSQGIDPASTCLSA